MDSAGENTFFKKYTRRETGKYLPVSITLKILACILLLLSVFETRKAHAEDLFFTYAGGCFTSGFNLMEFSQWKDGSRETVNATGFGLGVGPVIDLYVNRLIGEFSIQYFNNMSGNKDAAVQNLFYSATVKYAYPLREQIKLTGGLGFYFETEPASKEYVGSGGLNATIGAIYLISDEFHIYADIVTRYGTFGLGDNTAEESSLGFGIPQSSKLFTGLTFGAVYRIGRL